MACLDAHNVLEDLHIVRCAWPIPLLRNLHFGFASYFNVARSNESASQYIIGKIVLRVFEYL